MKRGMSPLPFQRKNKIGLILSGGGARAAYQVGVLQGIADALPNGAPNPFPIVCGTSAGAIDAVGLAARACDFRGAIAHMLRIWGQLHVGKIYRAGFFDILRTVAHWLLSLLHSRPANSVSLLDNEPLARLISQCVDFSGIEKAVAAGSLDAVCITASGYASGQAVSFFQGKPELDAWCRARRFGARTQLAPAHVLASTAIPFLFCPIRIGDEYFGDGSMRQLAPFSPALHLGAERVLAITVGRSVPDTSISASRGARLPPLAQIAGFMLDSVFLDAIEMDLERIERINNTVSHVIGHISDGHGAALRRIETLVLAPSEDISAIAMRHAEALPKSLRMLMRCLGGKGNGGANLLSYLLFEKPFVRELIELGRRDAQTRIEEILRFLDCESMPIRAGATIHELPDATRTLRRGAM